MITDRDICLAAATKHRPAAEISVSEVVSGPLHAVRADDDAKEALRVMRETQGAARAGRRLRGTLQGVVSINDFILRAEAKTGRDSLLGREAMDPLKRICQHRALNVQGHASHPIGSARATRDE
jgi:hypothetical protein